MSVEGAEEQSVCISSSVDVPFCIFLLEMGASGRLRIWMFTAKLIMGCGAYLSFHSFKNQTHAPF
jgi:hypothetical protein